MLNTKQQQAVDAMRAGKNVFLTGKAGTGKSYALSEYLRSVDNVAITAPTGIAALNIGGVTCHRAFALPVDLLEASYKLHENNAAKKVVEKMTTVVIDEISMVRADVFSHIEYRLSHWGGDKTQPFGGRQVIVVGDFHQLPPVVKDNESAFMNEKYGGSYAFDSEAWRNANFTVVELDEVMRQKGDSDFVDALNSIRENDDGAESALSWINTNCGGYRAHKDAVTLCFTNARAESINTEKLNAIDAQGYRCQAIVGEMPKISDDANDILTGAEKFGGQPKIKPSDHVAPEELRVKVGAKVMILVNGAGGFVNGSTGYITSISSEGLFVDGVKIERHKWEIKELTIDEKTGKIAHTVIGTISQLPIRLAWAITIHKSQGQTLSCPVHMALDGQRRPHGAMYVALSRATDVKNITLGRQLRHSDIHIDPAVKCAMARLTRGVISIEVPDYTLPFIKRMLGMSRQELEKWLG